MFCLTSEDAVYYLFHRLLKQDETTEGKTGLKMTHHLFTTTESWALAAAQQLLRPH